MKNPRRFLASFAKLVSAISFLSYLLIPRPAFAATWADIDKLTALIKETGTSIVNVNCKKEIDLEGVKGVYLFDKEDKLDHLLYCKENIDLGDSDEIWEVLSHEGTHIMQACHGGPIVKDEYIPRTMRNLKSFAPHYYKLVSEDYSSEDQRLELEAFDMELAEPARVIELFRYYCFE